MNLRTHRLDSICNQSRTRLHLPPFVPADGLRGRSEAFLVVALLWGFAEADTPLVLRHQTLKVLPALPQFLAHNLVPTHF